MFHLGFAHLDEVAVGGTEGIGGIELHVHVFLGNMEHALEHACHLFFGGGTVACNCHLDFAGFVFGDGYVAHDGSGDGYTLSTPKFEHGLYVLAKEGGFDCQFVGVVGINDGSDALENFAQTEIVAGVFFEFDDTHSQKFGFVAHDTQYAIAHHIGAGVNAEDDFFG